MDLQREKESKYERQQSISIPELDVANILSNSHMVTVHHNMQTCQSRSMLNHKHLAGKGGLKLVKLNPIKSMAFVPVPVQIQENESTFLTERIKNMMDNGYDIQNLGNYSSIYNINGT